MLKPRGPICDLDCSYCYYLSKERLYPGSTFRMSDEVLEAVTRQYLTAQPVPEVVFGWQGGEPTLMGTEFFVEAYDLLLEIVDAAGIVVEGEPGALFGGRLEAAYRSATTLTFGGGVNEVQRDIIAIAGLGLPRARR